jgi:rhamnogalacturonyl hydrolase YesR
MNNQLKLILTLLINVLCLNNISAQNNGSATFKVADNIIESTSFKIINKKTKELFDNTNGLPVSAEYEMDSPYHRWEYMNGVLAIGMIRLSEVSGNEKYKLYALNNYRYIFDNLEYFKKQHENGIRNPSVFQYFEMGLLDHCGAMSAGLCDVYEFDSQKEYKEYLNRAANYISNDELRLDDRTLVRSWPREMTLWADDLYMSVPFLARMAKITGDSKYLDDAILQVENFSKYLYNKNNGLYFHCYYSDNGQNGVAHWGRCNGWVMMAQVELLSVLPEDHPKRNHLIHLLEDHIVGLSRYQDNSGMWHQLINKPDSYLESSATAMIIYGVAKAVSEGWINPSYASIATSGWKGLVKKITEKGEVEDICVGTGIQDNLRFYYDRPTKLNDNHGLGAVILAGAEIIKLDLWMEQMKSK